MRECSECGMDFNPASPEKRRAGGLVTHCPDCSEETHPRALGFASGDGKQSALSILQFDSVDAAEEYKEYFARASGLRTGKNCYMHRPGLTHPNVQFKIVSTAGPMNHKGKM